jgi:hypothetical protein
MVTVKCCRGLPPPACALLRRALLRLALDRYALPCYESCKMFVNNNANNTA